VNSCLYECTVMHARFAPKRHRFAYRIFLFGVDLDELDTLHRRLRLFSVNRANLYSFREADYLPTHEPRHNASGAPAATPPAPAGSLKARVLAHLAAQGVDLAGGRIHLVTLPRVFGYLFNPVSFYFCHDARGTLVAALAEVTNTFREMKPFFLGPDSRTGDEGLRRRVPKHFYVSPFSDVDVAFDFHLRAPAGKLAVQIDDYVGAERTLTSTLAGPARPLTDAALLSCTLRHPLVTLKIIGLIHWHALRLWLKRVPWFAKAARAADQRDLYRAHPSLTSAPSKPA